MHTVDALFTTQSAASAHWDKCLRGARMSFKQANIKTCTRNRARCRFSAEDRDVG